MKVLAEPIDAIVTFKGQEKPTPKRFRYTDRNGCFQEIRVDRVLVCTETKMAGIRAFVYRCQSTIKGEEKLYELKFLVQDCRWELYKM